MKQEAPTPLLFAGCDMEGETLEGAHLSGESLAGSRLIDCEFDKCELSSIDLHDATIQAVFRSCKIQGINFFTVKRTFLSLNFEGCMIRYCSFAELTLPKATFTNCILEHVDFADAKLVGASFKDTQFTHCTFKNSDLSKVDFRGARGYEIDPLLNKVTKARFELPEAVSLLSTFDIRLD